MVTRVLWVGKKSNDNHRRYRFLPAHNIPTLSEPLTCVLGCTQFCTSTHGARFTSYWSLAECMGFIGY